ncbi:MAG: tRNA lysidine(34) synthetase TilS [Kiritimatiellia bacterium]|nr:tRNA lysidine(34) synthetase TilS [Kiritimatiellia bacterium]
MSSPLSQQVRNFIQSHHLIQHGQHVLIAVSGGADSIALLYVLRELKSRFHLRLTVAHLNHKIRGKDAEKDACFVKQLARRLHLDFALGTAAVPRLAGRLGISLEMAGRQARYDFFEKTALARRCDVVATAHTADDSVESILLMLMRGCGLQGLTGIPPLSRTGKITVVRPLLGIDRRTIEKYLRAHNLSWREDISNADPAFLRNRVRHELLPLLEAKYNKGIRQALIRLADVLRRENELLDTLAAAIYAEAFDKSRTALNCAVMVKHTLAVRRRVLRHWLKASDINAGTLNFQTINKLDSLLMNPAGGRSMELSGGIIIRHREHWLQIESREKEKNSHYRIRIAVPGRTILPRAGMSVTTDIGLGIWRERTKPGQLPARASLSLKAWRRHEIWARDWRAGDRMRPYGLAGTKKVQDIFGDAKVPVALRHRLPIFECAGEIIWLPGYRIAKGWEVRNLKQKALQLTVEQI